MLMKLKQNQTSTPPQTFEEYQHAWNRAFDYLAKLKRPNSPTPEMIEKAQFKDKTYRWNGR